MKYTLVNPFFTGDSTFTAEDADDMRAAKAIYTKLAKHIKNKLPRFFFSIMGADQKLSHFEIQEKQLGKKQVEFSIMRANTTEQGESIILDIIRKHRTQEGGKDMFSESSSTSSSDSSSDSMPERLYPYVFPSRRAYFMPMYFSTTPVYQVNQVISPFSKPKYEILAYPNFGPFVDLQYIAYFTVGP